VYNIIYIRVENIINVHEHKPPPPTRSVEKSAAPPVPPCRRCSVRDAKTQSPSYSSVMCDRRSISSTVRPISSTSSNVRHSENAAAQIVIVTTASIITVLCIYYAQQLYRRLQYYATRESSAIKTHSKVQSVYEFFEALLCSYRVSRIPIQYSVLALHFSLSRKFV